jgi:hypothetical protein
LLSNANKVISHNRKIVFFVIHAHSKSKVAATSVAYTQSLSLQRKQVDGIVEEYRDIFSSPIGVLTHCQVKHPIDQTHGAPLPDGPVYRRSLMEIDEINHYIQELLQKGHIRSSSSPCKNSIVLVQKKDGTW